MGCDEAISEQSTCWDVAAFGDPDTYGREIASSPAGALFRRASRKDAFYLIVRIV